MTALPPELLGRFVSPDRFGKDHHSTLLYVETRVVDHAGWLAGQHLRAKHPDYPTRLADGSTISMHSDFDCIEDMVMAGWIVVRDGEAPPRPNYVMRVGLTDAGWAEAHRLRRRKAWGHGGPNDGGDQAQQSGPAGEAGADRPGGL